MSETIVDTPDMSQEYCPACMPDLDPTIGPGDGKVYMIHWCFRHQPDSGFQDTSPVHVLSFEAGGEDNRIWCDLLHRGIDPPDRPAIKPTPMVDQWD